jgi:NAD(P)-dependent dehydrogenase (short-subunit alcohol dehydrogenase family)
MMIVTGGTHGIGRACVERLAREGKRVLFTGRDRVAGDSLEQSVPASKYVPCDVAIEADCRRAVDVALEAGDGGIDGLVNNAGISQRVMFADATVDDWERIMAVNARSGFLFTRLALPGLLRAQGSVVNVASIANKVGEEGLPLYCASKAAMIGLTQALALEFGDRVRFNAVCPGQVATRMMARIVDDAAAKQRLTLRIPMGRFADPDEIANVVAWLLSREAMSTVP